MIQTRQILNQYKDKYPDFEYYYTIIEKIEGNEKSCPDICIESCKSIIEGVSKSILDQLDKTQSRAEINKKDFIPLFKEAVKKLDDEYHSITIDESVFEIEICNQFGKQIDKLNTIRNNRSDISHGRAVPKEINSSIKLARTIKGVTDNIVAYILEHLFILLDALPKDDLLPYDSDEYSEFNQYIDAQIVDFPISKARYSQVLYDYEHETYLVKYSDYTSTTEEDTTITTVEYDSYTFWTDSRLEALNNYCKNWNMNPRIIISLLDKYNGNSELIDDEMITSFYTKLDKNEFSELLPSFKNDLTQLLNS